MSSMAGAVGEPEVVSHWVLAWGGRGVRGEGKASHKSVRVRGTGGGSATFRYWVEGWIGMKG